MIYNLLFIFISSLPIINASYNPIPVGSVIISTVQTVSVLQLKEFDGADKTTIIFTATKNMTIVNTIFDLTPRDLYILFTNTTNDNIYICKLMSLEELDSIIYLLPISFNISNINKLISFSSDITNRRAFLTNQTGTVTMFSMSGSMKTIISTPSTIRYPIRSVGYNPVLNRLFIITNSTVDSCTDLDKNYLQCCQALPKTSQLRSIAFDPTSSRSYAYVLDEETGIYQVSLDTTGCPVALRPVNIVETYRTIYLVMYHDLYLCSGSRDNSNHNSILIIGNGSQTSRHISFDASIVALHISYPDTQSPIQNEETCFHGIKYYDYRLAVILAAIFGTIMGTFMCFNALFCIDFFMTKRIIRDLKKQIPHNLLEDRWNRLVEEKYAKLALEIQRKKNDPPPKRKSSAAAQRTPSTANGNDSLQVPRVDEGAQTSNPLPKISAYLRRKSESYVNGRRSDDYRIQRRSNDLPPTSEKNQTGSEGIKEEANNPNKLRENVSKHALLKNGGELL